MRAMASPMTLRAAVAADLDALVAIYDHEARTGVATFDLESPPRSAWESRLTGSGPGEHLLVAEDAGGVLGYASASTYRPRAAYRYTRETSVYLAEGARGRGVGRALYDTLLPRLVADGMHMAVALVALPNPASEALHRACGFSHVGTLSEVGFKFERWIDTGWWEKRLR
jgi:L-amino acid N-acyltransferase YncA